MHTTMGADRPTAAVDLAVAAGNEPIEEFGLSHTTGPLMVEPDGVYTTKVKPRADNDSNEPPAADPAEAVIAAAVLVGTAWRLRDEDALVMTLRRLITALDALEVAA